MSVDYRVMIVYGKMFDSYKDAILHLSGTHVISDGEKECALDDGEYFHECGVAYYPISQYCTRGGVLGYEVSAEYLWTQPDKCGEDFAEVDKFLGVGCEVHEFVQVR